MKALEAINKYIEEFPEEATGYLEHGNLLDVMGKPDQARQSWLKVLRFESEGPNAVAARANIERVDVKKPATNQ